MSKLLYNFIKNMSFKNDRPSPRTQTFNRDPKLAKAKRVGYQLSNASGTSGRDNFETHDIDLSAIANAIRRDAYLTQGVMKYEELIFKSGWTLKSKSEQALEYIKYRLDVIAVATGIPTEELFSHIARDIVWSSNCFIVKARARNGVGLPPGLSLQAVPPAKDPVVGYFVLPPQTIEIARDQNGEVIKYRQEVPGADRPIEFKPEDIVHIAVNKRSGYVFGDPWLAPVIEDVRLLRRVEENAALLLYKHIFPSLKYKVGDSKEGFEATDEEIEEVRLMLEGAEQDSIFVMPERHDMDAINVNAIDGHPYLQYFENRVFSGMGLSQVDFGRGDTANRNTADAMTGQKADRIKGWQKIIQAYIDEFIINELLIEGGFDPLINPEFDVDFVFNEIELESKIKAENHEILKFNSSLQTWEETRVNLGLDPQADESRLHFNMIGNSRNEAAENQVDNNNQPQNQNGKRSGPKRSTESIQESVQENETKFKKLLHEKMSQVLNELDRFYNNLRKTMIEIVLENKDVYPIENAKTLISPLEQDELNKRLIKHLKYMFSEGVKEASIDLKVDHHVNNSVAYKMIEEAVQEASNSLISNINNVIKESEVETIEELSLVIASAFEANHYKLKRNVKTLLARAYNYGYAIKLYQENVEFAKIIYDGNCQVCKEKSNKAIHLSEYSTLSESAMYYMIPPWHYNCECELKQGGET